MNKKEYLKKKKQRNDNLDLLIDNLKTDDENFNQFIDNCLSKNGFLEEVKQ